MKKYFLLLILATCFLGGSFWYSKSRKISGESNSSNISSVDNVQEETNSQKTQQEISLPSSYNLKVPFFSQAPFGVWDELHDNACEEASILLVRYFKKKSTLSKEKADKEIKAMVDF